MPSDFRQSVQVNSRGYCFLIKTGIMPVYSSMRIRISYGSSSIHAPFGCMARCACSLKFISAVIRSSSFSRRTASTAWFPLSSVCTLASAAKQGRARISRSCWMPWHAPAFRASCAAQRGSSQSGSDGGCGCPQKDLHTFREMIMGIGAVRETVHKYVSSARFC